VTRTTIRALLPSCLALALTLASASRATEGPEVWIERPPEGEPTFGEVEVEAVVVSAAPITRVELFFDGASFGALSEPPFRWRIEVGSENRDRRFEVVVEDALGQRARHLRVTPAIAVGEEVQVRLHEVYVTVERRGEPVEGLESSDFEILDNGRAERVVTFNRGEVPITAVILLDASLSMRGPPLRSALQGALAFIHQLADEDHASILLFSDRLLHQTPFTGDRRALAAGLSRVEASGGTALNDHLYLAFKQLEERLGRRVVILLSDGIDSHSALTIREVQWLAQRSRALVYWLRTEELDPSHRLFSSWKGPEEYREEYRLLGQVVTESGGRILPLESPQDAPGAFEEIFRELRSQYILGYQPTGLTGAGAWRRLQVRVQTPGARVRAPAGYVDW
jgi:VWFA-related protein